MNKTILALVFACSAYSVYGKSEKFSEPQRVCQYETVTFSSQFSNGRLNGCSQQNDHTYTLKIEPESYPINPSPWYAFKVSANTAQEITVNVNYIKGRHRYSPKFSVDGEHWQLLPESQYRISENREQLQLALTLGKNPIYIAGQEVLDNRFSDRWHDTLAAKPYVEKSVIGHSVEGRPIIQLESKTAKNPAYLFISGRQHPPETTGFLGMMAFVERIWGNAPLAKQFRKQFNVVMTPNLNPDGIEAGHWRLNANKVDLNRDWGLFTQPETKAVYDKVLTRFLPPTSESLYLALDFHSTWYDIFYTQKDEQNRFPKNFTANWLKDIRQRLPFYEPRRDAGHNSDSPTFRNYVHTLLGIPAITYEMGDNTDRKLIDVIATEAADSMMLLLLDAYKEKNALVTSDNYKGSVAFHLRNTVD